MNDGPHLDTLGLWEAAAALPEQLTAALEAAGRRVRRDRPPSATAPVRAVAAFGLGTAGDRLRRGGRARRDRPAPCRSGSGDGAALPAFVDASHAGPRRVVRRATPRRRWRAAREARRARAGAAWWPSGASRRRWPRLAADAGLPLVPGDARAARGAARAALAAATVPLLVALARAGLGPTARRRSRRRRPPWPRRRDALARAGRRRRRSWPAGSAAPSRWSTAPPASAPSRPAGGRPQVNLNAKAPAFAARCPS